MKSTLTHGPPTADLATRVAVLEARVGLIALALKGTVTLLLGALIAYLLATYT